MAKVRILWPTGMAGTKWADKQAGEIVEMSAEEAKAHAEVGNVEPMMTRKKEEA